MNINPGAPNGGSGTQYFPGEFDGKTFRTDVEKTSSQWIDYGPDNYAGVTYFNAPRDRKIFMGWMSNWAYAEVVPTIKWRSAATAPRDLSLAKIENRYHVKSQVSPEFVNATGAPQLFSSLTVRDKLSLPLKDSVDFSLSMLSGTMDAKSFALTFYNDRNEKVVIGFDETDNAFYLDRSNTGSTRFSEKFNGRSTAPRISKDGKIQFTVLTDVASVEVFFDDGLSVLTGIYFPEEPLGKFQISAPAAITIDSIAVRRVDPIW